jgi:hypothetical protein
MILVAFSFVANLGYLKGGGGGKKERDQASPYSYFAVIVFGSGDEFFCVFWPFNHLIKGG